MRLLLVLLLLAGCSHVTVNASSNTAHTSTTGGRVGLHVESRSLAALVVVGMFIAAAADDAPAGAPPAELDPTRPVAEQDCTRPVELGANLKCR
jgi:hypothetical protein